MSSRSHVRIPASILIRIPLRKYAIEIPAPTRTALFTLILPGPPLRPFKGCQQILSHSFLFPAFAFQQAVKKIEAVPGILVCALQAVLRCTNIFQCELLNVDAKKATGAPGEHALVHEDVSCACAMLFQEWVILTCPLQTLMQSLATVESNNPLCFCYLGCDDATLCTNDRASQSAHQPLRIGTAWRPLQTFSC